MTLVISWIKQDRQNESAEVWTISDSKISSGETTLTLEGPKVLELHIKCKTLKGPPPRGVYYTSSIGYSYAGSSLIGLSAYAMLGTFLSNLGSESSDSRPDYKSISEKAKKILAHYARSIQQPTEVILYGFCPKFNQPFISALTPKFTKDGIAYELNYSYGLSDRLNFVILGDKKKEISQLLVEFLQKMEFDSHNYWVAPMLLVSHFVENSVIPSIGGGLQLAIASSVEFNTKALLSIEKNTRQPIVKFRNIEVFKDIGYEVGDCKFSIEMISNINLETS